MTSKVGLLTQTVCECECVGLEPGHPLISPSQSSEGFFGESPSTSSYVYLWEAFGLFVLHVLSPKKGKKVLKKDSDFLLPELKSNEVIYLKETNIGRTFFIKC